MFAAMRDYGEFIQRIQSMTTYDHFNLFKIFQQHGVHYSSNSNGVFINLRNVDESVLRDIDGYVQSVLDKKDRLDKLDSDSTVDGSEQPYHTNDNCRPLNSSISLYIQEMSKDDDWEVLTQQADFDAAVYQRFWENHTNDIQNSVKKTNAAMKTHPLRKFIVRSFHEVMTGGGSTASIDCCKAAYLV
jgi:hypothetical protein